MVQSEGIETCERRLGEHGARIRQIFSAVNMFYEAARVSLFMAFCGFYASYACVRL